MDLRALLEKINHFAGQEVGQKPGDQVRGIEVAKPTKSGKDHPFKGRLVGASESVLKDLSKGPTPKSKEQELAEEFQAFLEAEFKDTVDKRPGRKGARPARGHNPLPRYKTVKADESYMSEKDIELQDYRSMTNQEFQTAYGMTKTEWINKNKALVIQNPSIKKGLGLDEGVPYKATNPHPALQDPVVKKVLKQMRPGLTGLEMNNEAFLYFAYELGKTRAREMWEQYGPAIKYGYQSGIGVNEADDNNPVEARWIVKVEDDEGQHLKTFRDEFPNLAAAKKAYEKHKPYASDFKYTPVKKDQVEETVDTFNRAGYNPISNERDYLDKLSKLSNLYRQQGLDQTMKAEIFQRINDLNAEARKKGYIQAESRGHKILSTFFKNRELQDKFAKGELKIPTPQERQAQLKQLEKAKPVKEYGAANPPQKTSPAQAQQVAANLNIQKTALNQLKQINPEIDPAKAAAAMTKDTATMSPQEKDELAQVAKTVSPALGTPAFGSIKTAIQKSQIK